MTIDNAKGVFVLSPVDMVLHSATHLFHDGELEHGLRDLVDMHGLIGQFAGDDRFFENLADRAEELDLGRPLHYALKYCRALLGTPIPENVFSRVAAYGSRSGAIRALMEVVVPASIGSILDDRPRLATHLSKSAMYVRSHYLRMPLHLLLPHLLRKQFVADAG